MPSVILNGESLELHAGESVLECLERNGHQVMSSCRSGICQSCLMRAVDGAPPPIAQKGLRDAQVKQGLFLACSCHPDADLHVADCDEVEPLGATVESVTALGGRIVRLRLHTDKPLDYMSGQFANLILPDGTVRSYSIASVPGIDPWLEFHIALLPGGRTSTWLKDDAKSGARLAIAGPLGSCCYAPGAPDQNLLLLGTGTGLAPLYGILRDALLQRHSGAICVYHGCLRAEDVYYREVLAGLASEYPNLNYYAGVLDPEHADNLPVGDILKQAMSEIGNFKGWRSYVCGHPDFVAQAKRAIFLSGASMSDIFADAFVPAAPQSARSASPLPQAL